MILYTKRIMLASLFCMLPATLFSNSVSATAGAKAADKPITATFAAKDLPNKAGVNLFDVGALKAPKTFKGIASPPKTESLVELKMITDKGVPANLLIRRTRLSPEHRKNLRAQTQKQKAFIEKINQKLGDGNGIVTTFYTQHPKTGDTWTAVKTLVDHESRYSLGKKFDAKVYPNGLVALRINNKETTLFGLGDKSAQELITIKGNKGTIDIGNGQTVDAEQFAKSAL